MIVSNLIITTPQFADTLDVHPQGDPLCCGSMEHHEFFLTTKAVGFIYQICGRCGTVRIGENRDDRWQ